MCYLPGEAVRAIIPYDENPPDSNFIPSFPASTSTFPCRKQKKSNIGERIKKLYGLLNNYTAFIITHYACMSNV